MVGAEAKKVLADAKAMLKKIIDGKWLQAHGVLGLFPANSAGDDDIEVYTDESRREVRMTLHSVRQQQENERARRKADSLSMGASGSSAAKRSTPPATPLFDKSRTLYLIDKAKGPMRKSGQAVIVEGYTDALMAHQAGFENVVASLGTALTPGQVALITRYAKRIALAYDVDAIAKAGLIKPERATRRRAPGGSFIWP